MRLLNIAATAHTAGNRIDLTWTNPNPAQFPGVRVVRSEGTHPATPQPPSPRQGIVVADTNQGAAQVTDSNLKAETVYYYTLFPYSGDTPVYDIDTHNRVAAMATAPYAMVDQMADLLPALYHRYDGQGQLRRFLELTGGQLDQFYSFARSVLNLHNRDKVDGRLLPLLAQWIGWPTDFRLDIAAQRQEIGNAPYLYRTIGLIPTVEATVKRSLGLESRTKEFVHNLFRSNQPKRLNLWMRQRSPAGVWSAPVAPLSLDFAYEGRPAAVRDAGGTQWLFYHTLRKSEWHIWCKTFRDDTGWGSSQPLTLGNCVDKYPTAVLQRSTLWLFWSSFDPAAQTWKINFRTRAGGQWSAVAPLPFTPAVRRQPWAVMDNADGLWLFWLELVGTQWQLKYNRHDGTAWASNTGAAFPLDGANDPRVDSAPFVVFNPTDAAQRFWVFWAREELVAAPNLTRWRIVYRVKASFDFAASDWSVIRALPAGPEDSQDREPAVLAGADGNIELFWSSNRGTAWSIWHGILNGANQTWGTAEPIAARPSAQRDPLPLINGSDTLLIYRSNESVVYASTVYGATETVDGRYAGCETADIRNSAQIALRGRFDDFSTYTYDTGQGGQRTDVDWYARDTVGLYLPAGAAPQPSDVLKQFLPIQVRTVFLRDQP